MTIFLVRHGRPLVQRGTPAAQWELDPSGFDEVWALRERLPQGAAWCTSPEPKAVATAQLLTEGDVGVVEDLREHERGPAWVEDFPTVVARALARPDVAAYDGWEPAQRCRERVVRAVDNLVRTHAGQDLVLVGHGTAWALLRGELGDRRPAEEVWASLAMPDVVEVAHPLWSGP